jgi:hypothetical protein
VKITGEVIAVESNGEMLSVRLQGTAASDPAWLPMGVFTFQLQSTKRNERAYYIGRKVEIGLNPK